MHIHIHIYYPRGKDLHPLLPSQCIYIYITPGVRIYTLFAYLNDVPEGGGTRFTKLPVDSNCSSLRDPHGVYI